MKGMILAGGSGTRLYPNTIATSKQLLPVYDKPMIYYPLSVLMQAHIRDILIISTPHDLSRFQTLLGDGKDLGISITYAIQEVPNGIAECFLIGESFIKDDSVALILGDNIFYGHHLEKLLKESSTNLTGGVVFGYQVKNPSRYGVLSLDQEQKVIDIIEKPEIPPSSYAVTGLYFYDNRVIEMAKKLKPSARNELEITDVNRAYLQDGTLRVHLFDRGFAWLDTGTPEALMQASNYVHTIQERQGIKIACIEEIAYKLGFINLKQLRILAEKQSKSEYGDYLLDICSLRIR
mgnify:CR=1 FL=1